MKNRLLLAILTLTALAACQNEQTTSAPNKAVENQASITAANTTVAVTKPEQQHSAQDMQAQLSQNHSAAKQAAAQLIAPSRSTASPIATGDAIQGKALARSKCMACHSFGTQRKMGPGLKAIVGRQAGSMKGIKYSPALATGGWTWNEQNLAIWLCDSKKSVKILANDATARTRMPSQHICDPGKQANIIAFLKTL